MPTRAAGGGAGGGEATRVSYHVPGEVGREGQEGDSSFYSKQTGFL